MIAAIIVLSVALAAALGWIAWQRQIIRDLAATCRYLGGAPVDVDKALSREAYERSVI